jgi:hypothetical protein
MTRLIRDASRVTHVMNPDTPFSASENGAPLWGAVFVADVIAGFEPTGPLTQGEASLCRRGPPFSAIAKAPHLLGRCLQCCDDADSGEMADESLRISGTWAPRLEERCAGRGNQEPSHSERLDLMKNPLSQDGGFFVAQTYMRVDQWRRSRSLCSAQKKRHPKVPLS